MIYDRAGWFAAGCLAWWAVNIDVNQPAHNLAVIVIGAVIVNILWALADTTKGRRGNRHG